MARVESLLIVGGGLAALALAIALRQRRLSAAIDVARKGCVIHTQKPKRL